ncbi:MAG: CBS domain-containing protein [Proteobacteria bacterium]|jgi:predicted transcriptional regulator|nr:CBS domain-containing protein [Pseudomonadota bacterium]
MSGKVTVKDVIVSDVMTSPVKCMTPLMTVEQCIQFLVQNQISGAPVVDRDNLVVTVVSELDLMKLGVLVGLKSFIGENLDKLPPKDKLITIGPAASFKDLFKKFLTDNVRRVLVLDPQRRPLGIVARRDIIQSFLDHHD